MTGSVPPHAAPDPMGDWAEIRSTQESPAPAAAPQPKPSRNGAAEPERKKLLTIGLAMILAALVGAVIYGVGLSGPPDPPAPPRPATAERPAAPAPAPPAAPRAEPTAGTMQAPPVAMPGQRRASATFNALPACDEPLLQQELAGLVGAIPELVKAGERTTAIQRMAANGTASDGTRACRADLQTSDNLYQLALSLKTVDGFVEVTFLSLRKYVRGQPGAARALKPAHVVSTSLAVVRR